MNVLIGCEHSAIVRDAFLRRGHDAWSCDFLSSDGRQANHLQGDVRDAIDGNLYKFDAIDVWGNRPIIKRWDMAIFHPDCTYLCSSGLHWNKRRPERAAKTEAALAFVRELLDAPIERIALENPIGCISTRIRKPDQIIQPYDFGEDASKATCLWLKNLPPLQSTKRTPGRIVDGKERWANQTDSGQNRMAPSGDRWKLRSATYPGIAEAMADQWGKP